MQPELARSCVFQYGHRALQSLVDTLTQAATAVLVVSLQ